MKRRTLIKNLGGLTLLPLLKHDTANAAEPQKGVLRIAHLTDIHLKDDLNAPELFTKCLRDLHAQQPKVDFILNGGDIVFDMNKEELSTIEEQWVLYKKILDRECRIPMYTILGNHEVWWHEKSNDIKLKGKEYAMNQLNLQRPYYSFLRNNWKFVALDSVHLDVDGTWYIGKLDDQQFDWLAYELELTDKDMPICILSHIPILTATNLVVDDVVNRWVMLGGDMHTDTAKIIKLLYQYPNVKLCLSGHIHLREKLVYNDVTYVCNGAVSGAWWKGDNRETKPGYGLIDLYADGTFHEHYVHYT